MIPHVFPWVSQLASTLTYLYISQPGRYELRQEQPLGTDAENNWFSMQSALKARHVEHDGNGEMLGFEANIASGGASNMAGWKIPERNGSFYRNTELNGSFSSHGAEDRRVANRDSMRMDLG